MNITKFIFTHRDDALLVGDYKAYQHQLSRQLASLRKKLGRSTSKNAKFSAQKSNVSAEDIGKNHEFAHLLALMAERAYAHGMAMKTAGTEDGTGLPGATRRHIADRLHKAAKHAEHLAELLSDKGATKSTDQDILEARAYAYSLFGAGEFERHSAGSRSSDVAAQREKWSTCLENYSAARIIYVALLKATKEDSFKEHVASTLDPSIRFAAYQSHIPRTVPPVTVSRKCFPSDNAQLVSAIESLDPAAFDDKRAAGGATTEMPNSITWRSRKAGIVDASIGQALASVNTETEHLSLLLKDGKNEDQGAAYDPVLIASQDAADATRHAIDDHEKEKISEGDTRMQDLRVTNLAVNYDLIGWRVGRNRILIGSDDGQLLGSHSNSADKAESDGKKLTRLRERIVLYDAILQSLESVKDIPGAARDSSFIDELEGRKAYFQALKCLNIAYSHTILSSHRNALALLIRAESLSQQANDALASAAPSEEVLPLRLEISSSRLQSLHKLTQSSLLRTRALVELHNHATNSATAAAKGKTLASPIVETLNAYPGSGEVDLNNLVQWPPVLKPVPVKPLFFDTAWNYIEYPGRAQRAPTAVNDPKQKDQAKDEEKAAARGWFGFGRR